MGEEVWRKGEEMKKKNEESGNVVLESFLLDEEGRRS
jgi:hypothetical protein